MITIELVCMETEELKVVAIVAIHERSAREREREGERDGGVYKERVVLR